MEHKSIATKINEMAEFGAPYYTTHTDILSGLKQQAFAPDHSHIDQ